MWLALGGLSIAMLILTVMVMLQNKWLYELSQFTEELAKGVKRGNPG